MFTDFSSYPLGFIAGLLSSLSPCVLPLLPILAGTALNTHKLGPLALAGGLASSFASVGILLASLGSQLDAYLLRMLAAALLIAFGGVLLSPRLQQHFIQLTSGFGNTGQSWLTHINSDSLTGQFLLGMVLGVAWSPCVGPTLGATITLASQGNNLFHAALVMALFGIGAGLPLIVLGNLSQTAMQRYKQQLLSAGKTGKEILGAMLVLIGLFIVTGLDKILEAWLLNHAPLWFSNLSVAF